MSRDQFILWCHLFEGTTIRELRHIRDVPRASTTLRAQRITQSPVRERETYAGFAQART
ncbi:MAG TPA: hypothetical protein VIV40_17535 [Kofleriaceae bacterium]